MSRIHWIQHVPFEGLGCLKHWSRIRTSHISQTQCFNSWSIPSAEEIDALIVMGGPMNIHENHKYPWLKWEKLFIEKVIAAEKKVLGICLGAQLIADVLGAKVLQNEYKEIGWHKVTKTNEGKSSKLLKDTPDNFKAFHWHGDTFEIPDSCSRLAESEACANQAFEYDNRVLALQFHLESTDNSIFELISNCSSELKDEKYIQPTDVILGGNSNIPACQSIMYRIMDNLLD